jgi:hypothetical protein
VVTAFGLILGCSGSGGGTGGDGGATPADGGTPDGGCTGAACNPDAGPLPDGGTPDGGVSAPLTATPDRIVIGTTPGAEKSEQLTLQNTSGSAVSLQSLNVSGNGAGAFTVSGANVPMDVPAGGSVSLTVSFNGAAGVSQASLAAATASGTTSVPLGGLSIPPEPSLQYIFDVHNIPVTAGNPNPAVKDLPPIPIAGDEIPVQSFMKAGDGPVTLQLIGSFGPNYEPVSIDGWYVSGNSASRTTLFSIAQANAQVLDPGIESGGSLSFDPGTSAFGFWSAWPFWETPNQGIGQYFIYQEDALNTWDSGPGGGKHHMRVYPYRNPDGSQDPHAYIVTTEEAPFAVGPDYNDVVYIVRNAVPAGTAGGALQLQNQDGEPSSNRMMFNVITTIAPCWGPLTVKDTGTVTVLNLSGGTVTVSSVDVTDAFTVTPSTPLPAALSPGASLDLTVKFVATDGRVHSGMLNVHSDDASAPTRAMTLGGFRQDVPQNSNFPTVSNEPDLDEVVNGVYGYTTVVGTKDQLIAAGGELTPVGDEVVSAYWVKADGSQPVSMRLMSAFHSGWDCGNPSAISYGSFAYWFPKGRTSASDDHYILGGAEADIQRMLPRGYKANPPDLPAAGTFDPGAQQFGFHIELEFSDPSMAEQEPWCVTAGRMCGHRVRFWPVKDASGAVIANTWLVSVDMHQPAAPGVPFFSNYDYNDETYVVQNIMPAPQ